MPVPTIRLGVLAFIAGLAMCAGCSGGPVQPSTVVPSPPSRGSGATTITAAPGAIDFSFESTLPTPAPIVVTEIPALAGPLTVRVADPTMAGVSSISPTGPESASLSVVPISSGSSTTTRGATIVMIADAAGNATSVAVKQDLCGRPDALTGAQLLAPAPNATGVPTTLGTVSLAVYSVTSSVSPRLHLIDANGVTSEGGVFVPASPPPGGAAFPSPPPQRFVTTMAAPLPSLAPGTTYRVQVYDDTCQGPLIVGSFST